MTQQENDLVISIKNLAKAFVKQQVLDIESLDIKPGDRIALIGGNGTGKTTLIRCLLGHYIFDGDVSVFGLNPKQDRIDILKRVGFVPQLPPPISMTLKELVAFSAHLYEESSVEKTYEMAAKLNLDLALHDNKPFHKLSGGMKQKLLIALALAKKTDILFMDEPEANLDPFGRKVLFEQLNVLPEDTVMIISSHRVDEIKHLVNRVIEMDCGKIISDKKVEEL